MKFIDTATVTVKAGDGGNGRTSFRHEKFVDRGGPDGGDGGDGGSIIFVASRNQNTLMSFRYHKELTAEAGGAGGKTRKHGRKGKDLLVAVPVGTVVYECETLLADLTQDEERAIIAKGGRGGFGNAHFVSSVRQAPKFAEPGGEGEVRNLSLELKLIADVGLVGLPNAGKSTFLSVISNAKPEIADYPFTTLTPNLGVVDVKDAGSMLVADIPGLIEGAALGKGLGDEFLRHVERTAVLLHLVAATSDDIAEDYQTIQKELAEYKIDLSMKQQVVALSKTDAISEDEASEKFAVIKKLVPKGVEVFALSSLQHKSTHEILYNLVELVKAYREQEAMVADEADEHEGVPVLRLNEEKPWQVERLENDRFRVTGHRPEKFAARTDFSNEESVQRLKSILQKMGVMHELSRRGAAPGSVVIISSASFEL